MEQAAAVYVFRSSDDEIWGFSLTADGSNLPAPPAGVRWVQKDVTSLTAKALGEYLPSPHAATANLIMRGYHLHRTSAHVIPFPAPHRSSS